MLQRALEISSLTKSFPVPGGRQVVVKNFDVRIAPGEFVSLLGHSGCGKSTVLSIIAGLEEPTEGGVIIDGQEINGPGADRALFSSPSLLPWLSVMDNVLLACKQAQLAREYLELAGVAELAHRKPGELAAAEQQRVAIARLLSTEPRFLLLDEPFRELDRETRCDLQDLLLRVREHRPRTMLLVSDDVDEALLLSDRVLLMTDAPEARVGMEVCVELPWPRSRKEAREHPSYGRARERIVEFLTEAHPLH